MGSLNKNEFNSLFNPSNLSNKDLNMKSSKTIEKSEKAKELWLSAITQVMKKNLEKNNSVTPEPQSPKTPNQPCISSFNLKNEAIVEEPNIQESYNDKYLTSKH